MTASTEGGEVVSPCPICKRELPHYGAAKVMHLRTHVRKGELIERVGQWGRYEYLLVNRKQQKGES